MRRPSKFPLFWTKETSFDYALYNKLEAEADYFLLHDLRDWVQQKRYLDAVKTIIEVKALSEHQLEDRRNQTRCEADIEVQSFFGSYSGEKRYRSPCAIHWKNWENVRGCGSCAQLMQAHGPQYDDPPKRLTIVTKRIKFDETVCMNGKVS
jgi:predicted house-cleaning noncanonical NTP pyrophosphatase (MazG superfamily)